MATLKGQNFRICILDTTLTNPKYKVIGMATNCTVTLTNNTDDASHKDVVGAAAMPTTISKSWQVSCDSLNVADTAAMLTAIKAMQPMTLMWDETSTTDNQTRVKASFARKGQAFLSGFPEKQIQTVIISAREKTFSVNVGYIRKDKRNTSVLFAVIEM